MAPRTSRRWIHFVVDRLKVTEPWRVGRTTLAPAGRLLAALERYADRQQPPWPEGYFKLYEGSLAVEPWATIRVPVLMSSRAIDDASLSAAREIARETVAVLRFFQRWQVRYLNLERQTFGLKGDIGSTLQHFWSTDRRGTFGARSDWSGVMADWTFKRSNMRAFRADSTFLWLHDALRSPTRSDWEGRVITALRTLNLATVMQPPATRIMLQATALEALLGNPFRPGAPATGGHVLARRAAYLSCGLDVIPPVPPHGPLRGRCALLVDKDPRSDPLLHDPVSGGWACSWYGAVRSLYDARNAALHGSEMRFDERAATGMQGEVDRIIRAVVAWVVRTRPRDVRDLDHEIRVLPEQP